MLFSLMGSSRLKDNSIEMIKFYRPGEIVIAEGTKGTSAYIIFSGAVEVIKRSGDKEIAAS